MTVHFHFDARKHTILKIICAPHFSHPMADDEIKYIKITIIMKLQEVIWTINVTVKRLHSRSILQRHMLCHYEPTKLASNLVAHFNVFLHKFVFFFVVPIRLDSTKWVSWFVLNTLMFTFTLNRFVFFNSRIAFAAADVCMEIEGKNCKVNPTTAHDLAIGYSTPKRASSYRTT